MGNPAIDYSRPTLTEPDSIIENSSITPETPTGTNIFEFTKSEHAGSETRYALWRFVVDDAPLVAVVTSQGGRWFAELDWLNLFGEGESPGDAIDNLSDHIEYFIDFYSEKRPDELTDHAQVTRSRFLEIGPHRASRDAHP